MPRDRQSLTRSDWVAAARRTFLVSGIDDVKVDRLARRMKVTRGSFYWHFKSRKDLLDALLTDWVGRNRDEIARVEDRWAGRAADLADIVGVWLQDDGAMPAYDMAVRIWGRKSAPVAQAVRGIDEAWIELLRRCFAPDANDPLESFARARVVYFHQVGYYALGIRETLEDRARLAPYYHRILTGEPVGPALREAVEQARLARDTRKRSRARR